MTNEGDPPLEGADEDHQPDERDGGTEYAEVNATPTALARSVGETAGGRQPGGGQPWSRLVSPAMQRFIEQSRRHFSQLLSSTPISQRWVDTVAAIAAHAQRSLVRSEQLANLGAQQRAVLAGLTESLNTRSLLESARQQQATTLSNLVKSPQFSDSIQTARRALETSVAAQFDTEAFRDMLRRLKVLHDRYWPSNWVGYDIDYAGAWRVAEEDGIPLVWVPRGSLLVVLLDGPDRGSRHALLMESAHDVIDDCEAAVHAVEHDSLSDHRAIVAEAVSAWRNDTHRAAQAVANVAITDLLQHVYAQGKLARLARSPLRQPDRDVVALAEVRVALILEAAVCAIEQAPDRDEAQWPDRYNRHLTAHHVSGTQYTQAHALVAIMLACALVAETDALIAEGIVVVRDDAAPDDPACAYRQ